MEKGDDFLDEDFTKDTQKEDNLHIGLKILAFIIPLAGAIIYFTTSDEYPQKKQQACYAALLGIGFGIIVNVITALL